MSVDNLPALRTTVQSQRRYRQEGREAHVLVARGLGRLGRLVVAELVERAHQVRVLSRQLRPTPFAQQDVPVARGDRASGEGTATVVAGVHRVVGRIRFPEWATGRVGTESHV